MAGEELDSGGTAVAVGCRHYWIIEPAAGPTSDGRCQICGRTKTFNNFVQASTWGDEQAAKKKAQPRFAGLDGHEEDDFDDGDDEETVPIYISKN